MAAAWVSGCTAGGSPDHPNAKATAKTAETCTSRSGIASSQLGAALEFPFFKDRGEDGGSPGSRKQSPDASGGEKTPTDKTGDVFLVQRTRDGTWWLLRKTTWPIRWGGWAIVGMLPPDIAVNK